MYVSVTCYLVFSWLSFSPCRFACSQALVVRISESDPLLHTVSRLLVGFQSETLEVSTKLKSSRPTRCVI